MATFKYLIQSDKDPAHIYLRIRDGRSIDLKTKTGLIINPKNWSATKQKPINAKDPELKNLSFKLEDLKLNIFKAYNEAVLENAIIDSNWLNFAIKGKSKNDKDQNLIHYLGIYLQKKQTEISKRGLQKIEVLRNLLFEFQQLRKKEIQIMEVDLEFQNEFIHFLQTVKKYRQTTKHRTIKFLKTVIRDARVNGYKTNPQLDSLGVKDGKANIIYLTPSEIKMIENAEIDVPYLDNARKWLLLSCYLGQRGGDLLRCTKSDVKEMNGEYVLDIRQEKTDKPLYVLLLNEALKIIEDNGGEFPRPISTQNYNKYIKEVCRLAEIDEVVFGSRIDEETKLKIDGYFPKWELVTSHIGRRSFATNYYGRIPTPLLMAQTGHSTESMFLKYIGKGRIDQIFALSEIFKKSNNN